MITKSKTQEIFTTSTPAKEIVTTCCPQCHQEYFDVTVSASGSGDTEFGLAHWYEGHGHCHHCGYEGSDQSILIYA